MKVGIVLASFGGLAREYSCIYSLDSIILYYNHQQRTVVSIMHVVVRSSRVGLAGCVRLDLRDVDIILATSLGRSNITSCGLLGDLDKTFFSFGLRFGDPFFAFRRSFFQFYGHQYLSIKRLI